VSEDATYQVFARKYRPRTFDDVLGQDHVVKTLRNAIDKDRLAHAYLFVGPRGTGKTSTARILAKALNCPGGPKVDFDPDDPLCREIAEGNSLDVLEIDGASNNGVDQVRDLRETVQFAPASGQFKIYYIDEVHMLTTAAFNALLKTLEEPPPHVKFIFATTEPQKILPTIISRCQRFDLRRIPATTIAEHLAHIAKEEGITLSEAAAFAIAKGADGGMRDAQSMLDQLVAFCGNAIEESDVLDIFGFNSLEAIAELAELILDRKNAEALDSIHRHDVAGKDLGKLLADLIGHFRHVLVLKVDPGSEGSEVPPELSEILRRQAGKVGLEKLLRVIDLLAETDARMKWASNKKLHFEIGAIKAIQALGETAIEDVIRLVSEAAGAAAELPEGSATRAAPTEGTAGTAPVIPSPRDETVVAGGGSRGSGDRDVSPASAEPAGAEKPADSPRPDESVPAPVSGATAGPGTTAGSGGSPWERARAEIVAERPVLAMWLDASHFLRHEGDEFVIGFAAEQRFYRESLARHEEFMQDIIRRVTGPATRLVIEVSDRLTPIEADAEEEDEEPGPREASPETTPGDVAAASSEADPQGEGETSPPAGEVEPTEAFDNDPLIEDALEMFAARRINNNQ